MFDKQLLTALEQVAREAIVLHDIEKTAGRDEDEDKWARLTDRAEVHMNAIDEQLSAKEVELESIEEELDDALESENTEQMGLVLARMFQFWN